MATMTGGDAVYHALKAADVSCVFGIPSQHNPGLYDALCRHGVRPDIHRNAHPQAAVELARRPSALSGSILHAFYEAIPASFLPAVVRETANRLVGTDKINCAGTSGTHDRAVEFRLSSTQS
ncbi:thiamine pyrophosphate-binding protein [Paraburkholderia silviterrae]|nr:thiamine pyrophosphate-binding protein [Paraburkholderia silviterrae]